MKPNLATQGTADPPASGRAGCPRRPGGCGQKEQEFRSAPRVLCSRVCPQPESGPAEPRARRSHCLGRGSPEELEVSSFFSSSSLSLFSPPVSVPASLSLSVSLDSSTLMVGVLGRLLLGSLPLLRPPGRFGGVLIRSAVRAAANSFAPSYKGKRAHITVKFYSSFCWRRKKRIA